MPLLLLLLVLLASFLRFLFLLPLRRRLFSELSFPGMASGAAFVMPLLPARVASSSTADDSASKARVKSFEAAGALKADPRSTLSPSRNKQNKEGRARRASGTSRSQGKQQ